MGRKDFTVTERFFMLIGRELWSITVDNGLTIRTIMGLGRVDGEFSSHNFFFVNIAFAEFFLGQCRNIFWGYSACMNFFHKIFRCTNILFWCFAPPPPPRSITFPMARRYGNYVIEAQLVFLFLLRAVFGELFSEWTSKTLSVIVQDNIPWSILLSIIEMTQKICSETIRLLMVVLLECRPWKTFFDLYKGREKRTHFFRKVENNSSKRFPSAGARIQLSSCWLVPGLLR